MTALDRALLQRIDGLMAWLGITGRQVGSRWVGGQRGGRIEVVTKGANAAAWGAWSAGKSGRGLAGLIAFARGIPYGEAISEARIFLGEPEPADNRRQDEEQDPPPDHGRGAARARRIASRFRSIYTTTAERYLHGRGIPRPDNGWPDAIGFDPVERALAAIVTNDDGEVVATHRVFITPDGQKISAEEVTARKLIAVKRTDGPKSAGSLYLRNTGDGPVVVVEGLETGLAAYVSCSCDVLVLLGPFSHAPRQLPLRPIILAVEQDEPDSVAAKAVQGRVAQWAADGYSIALAWPCLDGVNKADLADVILAHGPAAVAERIAAAEPVRPPPGPRTSNLPAFYPRVTEDRDTALARQNAAMGTHMAEARRYRRARRALYSRRADAIRDAGGAAELSPVEKARITRRIHHSVAEEFGYGRRLPPTAPWHMFAGGMGTGKTTRAREFVAASPGLVHWVTELTHEKLREEYDAYRKDAPPGAPHPMLIRGRDRPDPLRPGHYMCDHKGAAGHVARAGYNVVEELCTRCKLAEVCGDHRQRREAKELAESEEGAVFFLHAAYAFVHAPVPQPDHAIFDETLLPAAIDVFHVQFPDVCRVHVPNIDFSQHSTTQILQAIERAFTEVTPTTPERLAFGTSLGLNMEKPRELVSLRHDGVDRDALRYLAKAVRAELDRHPLKLSVEEMSEDEVRDAVHGGSRGLLRQLLAVVTALQAEIDIPRECTQGIHRLADGRLRIGRLKKPQISRHTGVTALDGTGREGAARKLFGDRLQYTKIRFPRLAHVTGTRGKQYSRTSVTGLDREGNAIEARSASSARLRGDIGTILTEQLPPGSMIAATKRSVDALFDSGAVHDATPETNFGAQRGRNHLEDVPGALIVNAENVSLEAVEGMTQAFVATDPAPFTFMDASPTPEDRWGYRQWPYYVTRMRRLEDGTLDPTEVPVHPDPRAQEVLEMVREDEVLQTVERARPVWHYREFVLLGPLCIDVDYAVIRSHRELVAGGNPIERAYKATGIVPLRPSDLHRLHPTIFGSEKAAAYAIAKYPPSPSLLSLLGGGVFCSYRAHGQRGRDSRVLIDTVRHPDPCAAFAAVHGQLQCFQGVRLAEPGEVPASERMAARQPAWVAPEIRQPGHGAAPPSVMLHGPPDG